VNHYNRKFFFFLLKQYNRKFYGQRLQAEVQHNRHANAAYDIQPE